MNIVNRVDVYITSVNLPREMKTDAYLSVGASFEFKVTPIKDGYYF